MRTFVAMNHSARAWHVALAVVMLLMLTLFPHHHHEGGAVCWVAEVCHQDGRVNDAHTAHNHHDNQSHWCYWHKTLRISSLQSNQSNHFLPFDFWQPFIPFFRATHQVKRFITQVAHIVCTEGKHLRRRGPPVMCVV